MEVQTFSNYCETTGKVAEIPFLGAQYSLGDLIRLQMAEIKAVDEPLTFKEWLEAQPHNNHVDHSSWHSCAVGDFHRATGSNRVQYGTAASESGCDQNPICIDPMREYLLPEELVPVDEDGYSNRYRPYAFWDILNEGRVHEDFYLMIGIDINVCGGLNEILAACTHTGE